MGHLKSLDQWVIFFIPLVILSKLEIDQVNFSRHFGFRNWRAQFANLLANELE